MSMMVKTAFKVGDRVSAGDHYGTVRYFGCVEGAKGDYYGVEWDDASRGKHNGTHQGKPYFTTLNGEASGSFVKAKLLNPARSCIEAIKEKYGKIDDASLGIEEAEAFIPSVSGKAISIEVVGMKKVNDLQCRFDLLQVVDLSDSFVCGEDNPEGLGAVIPECVELNLSKNFISSWEAVGDIIKHLKNLRTLHLISNRLKCADNYPDDVKETFKNVRNLNMSSMNLTWQEVMKCSQLWLHVKELHLCKNLLTQIDTVPQWEKLQVLDLNGNSLQTWSNVQPFASLPQLEELYLYDCSICDIDVQEGDFPSLTTLVLSQNKISKWSDVAKLNNIKSLEDLSFSTNPVLEKDDAETSRQLIIAKITHLKRHNRTAIEFDERKGAEIDYLKLYGGEWLKCGATVEETEDNSKFYQEHPTYRLLVQKWGAPEASEVQKPTKNRSLLKKSLIKLTFVDASDSTKKTVSKTVPTSITVQKLVVIASKLLGMKDAKLELSYRTKQGGPEFELDHDMREISFYSVSDGDEILVRKWNNDGAARTIKNSLEVSKR